jgi:hypothetical protein
MDKFVATLTLTSPLVTGGGYLTLDAILAAVLFDSGLSVEEAHEQIPLNNTNGLWHGSAAVLEPLETGRLAFVANLRAHHDLGPDLIAKNARGEVHGKISLLRRRQYGAVMNGYQYLVTDRISWYGEGDASRVEALLGTVRFIGKRRASGFGEVTSMELSPTDIDGVVGPNAEPLRPVPIELFKGDRSAVRGDAAWRPAYWRPENRAICFLPSPNV